VVPGATASEFEVRVRDRDGQCAVSLTEERELALKREAGGGNSAAGRSGILPVPGGPGFAV